MYDVLIAGGSIAGLCCAREAALGGCSVMVIEDDIEVGTPDHCGGMVSVSALQRLQVVPRIKMSSHKVHTAKIFSPSGHSVSINAKTQNVISIDRRELDKEVAHQAQKAGAVIRVGTKYVKRTQDGIRTGSEEIACKEFVDARGIGPLAKNNPSGIIPCCQCEVYADWIKPETVEVHVDAVKYPGFFAWVIPVGDGHGKIGMAGTRIDPVTTLDKFMTLKGTHSVIRRIISPVWVGGPVKEFVSKEAVIIGDAAGQTKPTTAGGIFSCGMGGIIAGRMLVKHIFEGSSTESYQRDWNTIFGGEFSRQLLARKILGRIDNATLEKLLKAVTPEMAKSISDSDDFDFHAYAIVRLLGIKGTAKAAGIVFGEKMRKVLDKV
ncbi:MAG: dehydrogenase (flavoprotein)-like protein [Cenarchaeum symbiont of Oopsacas minuta]|nr:dehydrogenase (flavoprotein)-like protein [Cenarchaeum symbiont of Oopsacas minuta]